MKISNFFKTDKSKKLPVVAGMATMPSRSNTFPKALKSILKQVDHLYLFLDGFDSVPSILKNRKITIMRSQDYGNLKANGKFLGLNHISETSYYATFDDDMLYPKNYIKTMIKEFEKIRTQAVLGVFAIIFDSNFDSYTNNETRVVFNLGKKLKSNVYVDILGTDTTFFRTDQLNFDIREWEKVNMVDIHFALECAQKAIPRIAVKRKKYWIKNLDKRQPDSIYTALLKDDSHQTELAKKLMKVDPCKYEVARN